MKLTLNKSKIKHYILGILIGFLFTFSYILDNSMWGVASGSAMLFTIYMIDDILSYYHKIDETKQISRFALRSFLHWHKGLSLELKQSLDATNLIQMYEAHLESEQENN